MQCFEITPAILLKWNVIFLRIEEPKEIVTNYYSFLGFCIKSEKTRYMQNAWTRKTLGTICFTLCSFLTCQICLSWHLKLPSKPLCNKITISNKAKTQIKILKQIRGIYNRHAHLGTDKIRHAILNVLKPTQQLLLRKEGYLHYERFPN